MKIVISFLVLFFAGCGFSDKQRDYGFTQSVRAESNQIHVFTRVTLDCGFWKNPDRLLGFDSHYGLDVWCLGEREQIIPLESVCDKVDSLKTSQVEWAEAIIKMEKSRDSIAERCGMVREPHDECYWRK